MFNYKIPELYLGFSFFNGSSSLIATVLSATVISSVNKMHLLSDISASPPFTRNFLNINIYYS